MSAPSVAPCIGSSKVARSAASSKASCIRWRERRSPLTSVSNATLRTSAVLTKATQTMPSRIAATRSSVTRKTFCGMSMFCTAMMPTV